MMDTETEELKRERRSVKRPLNYTRQQSEEIDAFIDRHGFYSYPAMMHEALQLLMRSKDEGPAS